MRKTEHVGFYGRIRSEMMQISKVRAYCQNAKCKQKHQTFEKDKMIVVNEYLFCTTECSEVLQEEQLTTVKDKLKLLTN